MDIDKEKRHIPVKHLDDGDHRVVTGRDHSRMVKEFIVVDGRIVPIDVVDDGDGPLVDDGDGPLRTTHANSHFLAGVRSDVRELALLAAELVRFRCPAFRGKAVMPRPALSAAHAKERRNQISEISNP